MTNNIQYRLHVIFGNYNNTEIDEKIIGAYYSTCIHPLMIIYPTFIRVTK